MYGAFNVFVCLFVCLFCRSSRRQLYSHHPLHLKSDSLCHSSLPVFYCFVGHTLLCAHSFPSLFFSYQTLAFSSLLKDVTKAPAADLVLAPKAPVADLKGVPKGPSSSASRSIQPVCFALYPIAFLCRVLISFPFSFRFCRSSRLRPLRTATNVVLSSSSARA